MILGTSTRLFFVPLPVAQKTIPPLDTLPFGRGATALVHRVVPAHRIDHAGVDVPLRDLQRRSTAKPSQNQLFWPPCLPFGCYRTGMMV